MILAFNLVCGAVLGARFNVLVLIPATLLSLTICALTNHDSSLASTIVELIFSTTALQLGYLMGTLASSLWIERRLNSQRVIDSVASGSKQF